MLGRGPLHLGVVRLLGDERDELADIVVLPLEEEGPIAARLVVDGEAGCAANILHYVGARLTLVQVPDGD